MPKYQNNSSSITYRVENWSGEKVNVGPGETVRTYQELSESDFAIVSQKPYYNNVLTVTQIAGTGDKELTLNSKTAKVEVYNVSSYSIRTFINTKLNTPARIVPSGSVETIKNADSYMSKLIFTPAGSVVSGEVIITEFKE